MDGFGQVGSLEEGDGLRLWFLVDWVYRMGWKGMGWDGDVRGKFQQRVINSSAVGAWVGDWAISRC